MSNASPLTSHASPRASHALRLTPSNLRTSFVAVLEEAKRKDANSSSDRISDQKRSLEGISQRKNLDKHEIETTINRSRQLDDEYQHRLDRRELFNEKPEPTTVAKPSVTTTTLDATPTHSAISPNIVWLRQSASSGSPTVAEPATPVSIPTPHNSAPTIPFPQTATVDAPISPNALLATVPAAIPTATVPVDTIPKLPSDPSVFTIFTVSGRFGTEKKESDEKKTEKRERGISLFGSLLPLPIDDAPPSEPTNVERQVAADLRAADGAKRQSVEPASVEPPKKKKEGISLKELFDPKEFAPTNESYKGKLPDRLEQSADVESGAQIQADRDRFFQRVAAACQSAANRNGPIRIKLHPESLGPLTVRVSTKKGKLSVYFETETDDAKRLLLDSIDELKAQLRNMNIELEECRVD